MGFEEYKKEIEHLGQSQGIQNHDHDMVHELSRRLDALWRYDQYIVNAKDHKDIQNFWKKIKKQEQKNIEELKQLLTEHIKTACF